MALDAPSIARLWLQAFEAACREVRLDSVLLLMLPDGWWRDLLCLSWDFRSLGGRASLENFLLEDSRLSKAGFSSFSIDSSTDFGEPFFYPIPGAPAGVQGIQFSFSFHLASPPAVGDGMARLLQNNAEDGQWQAFTLFTTMRDLAGHSEPTQSRPIPPGVTWQDYQARRTREIEAEPTVLIIGGAQNGLVTAARFGQMGIRALVVERDARVGDTWRRRYPSLTLHTRSNVLSFLYERYPSNFPDYMPKDRMADALEAYVTSQNLVVWTSSTVSQTPRPPSYDRSTRRWTIHVSRGGVPVVLHPKHVVMATGFAAEKKSVEWPGLSSFRGEVYHASQHPGADKWIGKRAVVIGAGQSAADICQDFVRSGACDVVMIQRSATCVASLPLLEQNVYSLWPANRSIHDSDFAVNAMPQGLLCALAAGGLTGKDKAFDKDMLDGLTRAGFKLTWGEEHGTGEIGLFGILLQRFGGYWLDVGCAEQIINGKIRIKQGVQVQKFVEDGLVFEDGTKTPADVVVVATGYESIRETARKIFGAQLVRETTEVWGLDEEGETRGMYRPSGHPAFWYAVGGFNHARFYSKHLGLQILARELDLV